VLNFLFNDAINYLGSFGFQTQVGSAVKPNDRVASQHPVARAEVPRGTIVTIYR
jgi:beta-lactam-binding protein with PASTA domain